MHEPASGFCDVPLRNPSSLGAIHIRNPSLQAQRNHYIHYGDAGSAGVSRKGAHHKAHERGSQRLGKPGKLASMSQDLMSGCRSVDILKRFKRSPSIRCDTRR